MKTMRKPNTFHLQAVASVAYNSSFKSVLVFQNVQKFVAMVDAKNISKNKVMITEYILKFL